MTYPNDSRDDPAYGRRRGLGGGGLFAIIFVIALIAIGAFYWSDNRGASTASNDRTTATTTGSAPASPPPAPATTPAKK